MIDWLIFGVAMIPFILIGTALVIEAVDEYRR